MNTKAKHDIAKECYDYMSTSAGKEKVLNPPNRTKIAYVNWGTTDFEKEIAVRVDLYVEMYLQSDGVLQRYKNIKIEINEFSEQVISVLSKMEIQRFAVIPKTWTFSPMNALLSLGVVTSPVWMTALAVGFGLATVVGAGLALIVGGLIGWFKKKTGEEIDREYNKHIVNIQRKICDHLDKNCSVVIIKLIDKVTEDILPKKIRTFKTMIQQLSETRDTIKADQKRLEVNAVKIRNMEDKVTKLTEYLNS